MLTKSDINQIGNVIDEKLDLKLKPIKVDINELKTDFDQLKTDVKGLKKDMKITRRDVTYLKQTVGMIAKNYDEGDVRLERRVKKLEEHLSVNI